MCSSFGLARIRRYPLFGSDPSESEIPQNLAEAMPGQAVGQMKPSGRAGYCVAP